MHRLATAIQQPCSTSGRGPAAGQRTRIPHGRRPPAPRAPTEQAARSACSRSRGSLDTTGGARDPWRLHAAPPVRTSVIELPATPPANSHGGSDEEYGDDGDAGSQDPSVTFVSLVDGTYTVRGQMRLDLPADLVYDLLTDYASCPRVFSNIAASETLTADDGSLRLRQVRPRAASVRGPAPMHVLPHAACMYAAYPTAQAPRMRGTRHMTARDTTHVGSPPVTPRPPYVSI